MVKQMSSTPENLTEEILEELGPNALVEMNIAMDNSLLAIAGFEEALVQHILEHPKSIWAPLTHTSIAVH